MSKKIRTLAKVASFVESHQSIKFTQDQMRMINHRLQFAGFDTSNLDAHGVKVAMKLFNEILANPGVSNVKSAMQKTASFVKANDVCPAGCGVPMVAVRIAGDVESRYCPQCRLVGVVELAMEKLFSILLCSYLLDRSLALAFDYFWEST